MIKKNLYLDIDDTVLDTENYIRSMLGGKWLYHNGLLYNEYGNMSPEDLSKVLGVLSNYDKIPFINGAREGLDMLKTEYNITFCSSYFTESEAESKMLWSKKLGIPLILCKGFTKGSIDMSGAVLVEDNTRNLDRCNASVKVCFYKKYNFEKFKGTVVFDWFELLDALCPSIN